MIHFGHFLFIIQINKVHCLAYGSLIVMAQFVEKAGLSPLKCSATLSQISSPRASSSR